MPELAALSALGERGFELLAGGIGDYCTRPPAHATVSGKPILRAKAKTK